MSQTLAAKDINLRMLIDQFDLQKAASPDFFAEWRATLPALTPAEQQALDKIRAAFFNLLDYPPLSEKAIQLTILSPLLFLADFFLPPFHIKTEQSIAIQATDDDTVIRGQLDIVLIKDGLWALVIESKRADFSVEAGLAQLLAYMLSQVNGDRPGYGMITTGGSFLFVKVARSGRDRPQYATSDQFDLRRSQNELYDVFKILRHLAQLA